MKKLIACLFGLLFSIPAFAALPSGYTEVEYISNGAGSRLDTGIVTNVDDVEYEIRVRPTGGSWYIFQSRDENSRIWGVSGSSTGSTILFGWAGYNSSLASSIARDASHIYYIKATAKNGTATLYVRDETANTEDTKTVTYTSVVNNLPVYLFGNQRGDYVAQGNQVYYAKLKVGGELKMNYIPAKQGDTVGFYDTVSQSFKTATIGSFTGGNELDPCRNLFDGQWEQGTFQNTGEEANSSTRIRSGFIPVNSGRYTMSTPTQNVVIHEVYCYDSSENFVSKLSVSDTVVPATAKYLRFSARYNDNSNISPSSGVLAQLELGNTATRYTPYNSACFNTCPAGQVLQTYTTATGTVTQNGTPTPTNPIEPTFYTQGNIVLRAVGNYKDSYDASTGIITRRVGVKVLNGTESWGVYNDSISGAFTASILTGKANGASAGNICAYFPTHVSWNTFGLDSTHYAILTQSTNGCTIRNTDTPTLSSFKSWLAERYAAGAPVTVYYPLAEPYEETWVAEQCSSPIKIATNAYNAARFSPVVTALNTAISTIKTVVANTISQTAAVASLQRDKQQKPADAACPAGKKCLLVEDSNGTPHWYEIVESYYNPTLPVGYTELAYLESTGTQWIDTGYAKYTEGNVYRLASKVSWADVQTRQVHGVQDFFYYGVVSGYFQMSHGATNHLSTTAQANTNYEIDATFNAPDGTTTYSINGSTPAVVAVNGSATGSGFMNSKDGSNFAVFSLNDNTLPFGTAKVYYYKLYHNGNLVRDMIPARRESDGVLGMYDLANGQFYTNAGTGTFNAGPVVLPAGYTTLQYIQSNGTQYIDTGFTPNQDTSAMLDAQILNYDSGTQGILFGARTSSTENIFNIQRLTAGNWNMGYNNSNFNVGTADTNRHVFYKNKQYQYLDGVLKGTGTYSAFTCPGTAVLFGTNNSGTKYATAFPAKVWSFKMWDNGTLVRNFVPAQTTINGQTVNGMYDVANGQFYGSAVANTNFTAGPVAQ